MKRGSLSKAAEAERVGNHRIAPLIWLDDSRRFEEAFFTETLLRSVANRGSYFSCRLPNTLTSSQWPESSNEPTPTWPQAKVLSWAVMIGVFMSSKYTAMVPSAALRTILT